MGTIHGKNAVLYMAGTAAGNAVQIAEAAEFTIDTDRDLDPDPALGDEWETKLKGLKRFSGSFNGNFDDAQKVVFDAVDADDDAVGFYLYPAVSAVTRYYYGDIFPVVSISGGTGGRVTFAVTFDGQGQLATNP
ncbi:hypothetical protein LCGC14_0519320 [marine sediment metagenome]|uniref:Phage tail protein n=2 Tax=root TaxID=1 RepID=A0A9C9NII7_9HYPH|nr:hypothetical protein [Aurantimonas coralicida]